MISSHGARFLQSSPWKAAFLLASPLSTRQADHRRQTLSPSGMSLREGHIDWTGSGVAVLSVAERQIISSGSSLYYGMALMTLSSCASLEKRR